MFEITGTLFGGIFGVIGAIIGAALAIAFIYWYVRLVLGVLFLVVTFGPAIFCSNVFYHYIYDNIHSDTWVAFIGAVAFFISIYAVPFVSVFLLAKQNRITLTTENIYFFETVISALILSICFIYTVFNDVPDRSGNTGPYQQILMLSPALKYLCGFIYFIFISLLLYYQDARHQGRLVSALAANFK